MDDPTKSVILAQALAKPWNGVQTTVVVPHPEWGYPYTITAAVEEIEVSANIERWFYRCPKHYEPIPVSMPIEEWPESSRIGPVISLERRLWGKGSGPYSSRFGVYLGQCKECHTIYYGIIRER